MYGSNTSKNLISIYMEYYILVFLSWLNGHKLL